MARGWDARHDNMLHLRDETKGSGNIFSPLMDGRLKVPAMRTVLQCIRYTRCRSAVAQYNTTTHYNNRIRM